MLSYCMRCPDCGGAYRRNTDEDYLRVRRDFVSSNDLPTYARLLAIMRRGGRSEEIDPPLARWQAIVDEWEYHTWDVVVEAGTSSRATGIDPSEITPREASLISTLDFYGREIRPEHAMSLYRQEPYESPSQYSITYNGIDGVSTNHFDDLEDACEYVADRLPDALEESVGDTSFSTDFGHYSLDGFTIPDCGDGPGQGFGTL